MVQIGPIIEEGGDLLHEWRKFKFNLENSVNMKALTTWGEFYERGVSENYPNLFKLISISLILPLSTAIVERGFSVMNANIKNKLRNRLHTDTVSKLMNISMNGPEKCVGGEERTLTRAAAELLKSAKDGWVSARNRHISI